MCLYQITFSRIYSQSNLRLRSLACLPLLPLGLLLVLRPHRLEHKIRIVGLIVLVLLAPLRIRVLRVAARVVPHPSYALLRRVLLLVVERAPDVLEAARTLEEVHLRKHNKQSVRVWWWQEALRLCAVRSLSRSLFTEIVSFLGRWYIPLVEMHPMFIARSLMRTQVTLKLP